MDKEERWRFEPDTALLEAMEAHYDQIGGLCFHDDEYKCVRMMIEWLDGAGVAIVLKEWVREEVQALQGEIRHA